MRRLVLGTAGHVDHGKSSLVKALTGIDPDRLAEEKRRGITIELGFAHLKLPDGSVLGVVDVPGHERFVRAMAAGAGGVDLVLFVVAADEGVMPQTREHLDICRLLGVKKGVVALTKSDLLAELGADWLAEVKRDVAEAVRGSFLEGAPLIPVSSKTGEGLADLLSALQEAAGQVEERPTDGLAFLPIDRAFTLKGFGTVVTGTLFSGTLKPEELVDLVPDGPEKVRVRGIQIHGRPAERAQAGQRTAVNLAGVAAEQVARGMVLVPAGRLQPTPMVDVEIEYHPAAPESLRTGRKLLCHLGTAQTEATVALLDGAALAPGGRGFAQLRFASKVPALPDQRFILRGFEALPGRGHTVAGGRVLAIHPHRRHRGKEGSTGLAELAGADKSARLAQVLLNRGIAGSDLKLLSALTGFPSSRLGGLLASLAKSGQAVLFDPEGQAYVARAALDRLCALASEKAAAYLQANPLAPGMPKEELRSRLPGPPSPKLFAKALAELAAHKKLDQDAERVRPPEYRVELMEKDSALKEKVLALVSAGGVSPPTAEELASALSQRPERLAALLKLLEGEGKLVKIAPHLYLAEGPLAALRDKVVAHLQAHKEMSTQELKELTGATRKFTIPLAEYFDRVKLTMRVGEKRVLRGGGPTN